MTIKEFRKTKFFKLDMFIYRGKARCLKSLDFDENLIGLKGDKNTIDWVRCENVEYKPHIPYKGPAMIETPGHDGC